MVATSSQEALVAVTAATFLRAKPRATRLDVIGEASIP